MDKLFLPWVVTELIFLCLSPKARFCTSRVVVSETHLACYPLWAYWNTWTTTAVVAWEGQRSSGSSQRQLSWALLFQWQYISFLCLCLHIVDCGQAPEKACCDFRRKWLLKTTLQGTVFAPLLGCRCSLLVFSQWQIASVNTCWCYNLKTIISHKWRVCMLEQSLALH